MPDFQFSPAQVVALADITRWYGEWRRRNRQIFYLAGYAGTGKTEIAVEVLRRLAVPYSAACYTGKAASILRRRGIQAGTIHSLIYRMISKKGDDIQFEVKGDSVAGFSELILIDEGGTVDDEIARDLLNFGKPILVTADPAQLPPIRGTGFLIEREPDILLTEIHRQAAGSPVLELADTIRQGYPFPRPPYAVETAQGSVAVRYANIVDVVQPGYQVICGVHRVRWEVTSIIRKHFGFTGVWPQSGERVMCIQNDMSEGLLNGMVGMVTSPFAERLPNGNLRLRILMDDEAEPRTFIVDPIPFQEHYHRRKIDTTDYGDMCRFDFAYVLTCHKAQGDQYDNVVLIDDGSAFRENKNKWRYTGVSRARKNLIVLVR